MNYLLTISIIVNILLAIKILTLRKSVRDLGADFSAHATLDSNTLIGVTSRDRYICALASSINETITSLRDSYHKYRQGDAEIKTAITNIAHDLRTPLTAICGYLELSMKQDMSDDLRKNLTIIDERAQYMKGLTEELFEYSVITGGEITEELATVNVNRVLEDCVMNYYPALLERGIEPKVDITETKIERQLYPTYVERIFNNLISNALKYSDGDLEISLSDNGTVKIANSASSLSNVEIQKLFDRFFTVENARSHAGGLGLSIVKTFATRMNCPIEAKYNDGKLIIEIKF